MLSMDEFMALFGHVEQRAWRLLTLDSYNASAAERARIQEWERAGRVPDRTDDPWLRLVADYAQAGIPFARVHVFPGADDLSRYCEYVLDSYAWNDAAGERVDIADRRTHPELAGLDRDFWVLDETVVVLGYDDDRDFAGAYVATGDEADLRREQRRTAQRWAVPLADYTATRRARRTA